MPAAFEGDSFEMSHDFSPRVSGPCMQRPSVPTRVGSLLMLPAAGITGLTSHVYLLVSAVVGGAGISGLLGFAAGKALLAGVGGYLSVRALHMSRGERLVLLGAFEIGPLLMVACAIGNGIASGTEGLSPLLFFLLAIPDVAVGWLGVGLARQVDESQTTRR